MTEDFNGVNVGMDTSLEQSPGSEGVENTETNQELSTDESLNTGTIPEHIPYTRFKEKVDRVNQLQSEIEQLKSNQERYSNYEKLDSAMQQNPAFSREINGVIERFERGEITQKQAEREISDIKEDSIGHEQFYQQKYTEDLVARYEDRFDQLFENKFGEDKANLDLVYNLTSTLMGSKERNAFSRYDRKAVDRCFNKALEMLGGYSKNQLANYVNNKTSDSVIPNNNSKSTVRTEYKPRTQEERADALAKDIQAMFKNS